MVHTLHVALLGRGAVRVDDSPSPVVWPRPAARRLVLLLAVSERHRRRRDDLVGSLVPHLPTDRAARAVSKALSQARSVLPGDLLEADRDHVWLAEGTRVRTDVEDRLDRVRALLADPSVPAHDAELSALLDDVAGVLEGDLHEDWAADARTSVAVRVQAARRAWADRVGSVPAWAAVVAHDPLDDEAVASLAAAAEDGEQRDAALAALRTCADRRAELDLAPSGVLADAIARVGGGQPGDASTGRVLHGREDVRSDVLVRLRAGQHVAVVGQAGIGKSALLEDVAVVLAGEGWVVGTGTSMPEDRLVPLASLRSALRGCLPPAADPLARRAGRAPPGEGAPRSQPADLAQLADELDAALRQGPGRRLLVLDDVQWADGALQRVLVRLLSRRSDHWVVLVGGRSDEDDAPLPPVPPAVAVHDLRRVDDDAAARIVRGEGADPAVVADLVRRGAGNPFFLVELARATRVADDDRADAHVPDRVVALLRARVDTVDAPARRLLELLAVLGEDAAYDVLAAAGVPLGPRGAHLDELLRRRLVRDGPAGPRLLHPLLRETVLVDCNRLRRAELHERAASALVAGRVAEDLARQRRTAAARHRIQGYREAPLPERAAGVVRDGLEAGHEARRLLADDVAEELFTGALEAHEALPGPDRSALAGEASGGWVALGRLRLEHADADGAREAFGAALALAPDDEHRAEAWAALSWVPYRAGDWAGAVSVCEQGLADLAPGSGLARARLLVDAGWCRHRLGEEEGLVLLRAGAQVAEEAGDWPLAGLALDRLGSALDEIDGDESLATLARARAACSRTGDRSLLGVIELHTAGTLHRMGRDPEALVVVQQALDLVDAVGDAYTRSVVRWVAALVHDGVGDLPAALAARDEEVALLEEWGNDRHLAGAHAHRSRLLRRLGDEQGAERAAEEARRAADRAGAPEVVDLGEDELVG